MLNRPLGLALSCALLATALAVALVPLKGAAFVPPNAWIFPDDQITWFGATADLDGDGVDELIMPTVDGPAVHELSPPTAVHVLRVEDQILVDRTTDFFATVPMTWAVRRTMLGDFDGDGVRDIVFCGAGRETTDRSYVTLRPRVPGAWGEQNQVWLRRGAMFVDASAVFPQAAFYNHGCSVGDVDHSGHDSIMVNQVGGAVAPYPPTFMASWDGAQFAARTPFPLLTGTRTGKPWGFFTATGDYDKNGYADVVGDLEILWGTPTGPVVAPLPPNALVTPTFGNWQGEATADLNGDGYPDLVKVLSTTPAVGLTGSRFVLYTGGPNRTLTEKLDAFPALATYNDNDFGIEPTVIDVNFDGLPDLVTFGSPYYGVDRQPKPKSPTAVWLNDGAGRFTLAHFSDRLGADSVCGGPRGRFSEVYFLKTADPMAYNMIVGGCYPGAPRDTLGLTKTTFSVRTVTPDDPLTWLP